MNETEISNGSERHFADGGLLQSPSGLPPKPSIRRPPGPAPDHRSVTYVPGLECYLSARLYDLHPHPSPPPMRYVIVYDIEDDRTRDRVAKVLERYGERVQKSVFECVLEPEALDRLTGRLAKELGDPQTGNIRVYRLCANCLEASFGLGELAPGTTGEPWIVV